MASTIIIIIPSLHYASSLRVALLLNLRMSAPACKVTVVVLCKCTCMHIFVYYQKSAACSAHTSKIRSHRLVVNRSVTIVPTCKLSVVKKKLLAWKFLAS